MIQSHQRKTRSRLARPVSHPLFGISLNSFFYLLEAEGRCLSFEHFNPRTVVANLDGHLGLLPSVLLVPHPRVAGSIPGITTSPRPRPSPDEHSQQHMTMISRPRHNGPSLFQHFPLLSSSSPQTSMSALRLSRTPNTFRRSAFISRTHRINRTAVHPLYHALLPDAKPTLRFKRGVAVPTLRCGSTIARPGIEFKLSFPQC